MLPLKLARSLLLHETLNLNQNSTNTHDEEDEEEEEETSIRQILTKSRSEKPSKKNTKTPLLFFVPTKELISDTYRLATISRDLGMDLYPTPSLSHIIFSFPQQQDSTTPSSCSSSLSWSLPNDAVMLSFPSLSASSLSHLRSFVSLSNGLFKLVFSNEETTSCSSVSNWDCSSVSLFVRVTKKRIGSMESFSQVLASNGWTMYKTKAASLESSGGLVYLFRRVYSGRVMNGGGSCRVRELRLPLLDFRNAPLRILQYLMLMTDDVFYLA